MSEEIAPATGNMAGQGPAPPAVRRRGKAIGPRALSVPLYVLILFVIVIGIIYSGWHFPPEKKFVAIACLMTVFLMVLGYHTQKSLLGSLITNNNVMSLSRFQLFIWTIIILSGYFAFAFTRIVNGDPKALDIAVEPQVMALMGITTASPLIGASVLHIRKKSVYVNESEDDADFTDIFEGDEVANGTSIDFSKVQMFFFTVIAASCFAVNIYTVLAKSSSAPVLLETFPSLSEGFVWILGISHLGYLGNKAVPQGETNK